MPLMHRFKSVCRIYLLCGGSRLKRPIWTGKPEEIRAAVSVPKRAPFDIFDPVILKCMLTETRGELELKAVLIVPDRATFDLTRGSKKAEENSPFPERLMNKAYCKVCCADESYVCFARDDEDKLLVYGFETVDTEDTWDAGCSDAGLLTFARGCLKLAEIELLMFAGGCSEVLTDKVEKLCCVDESYIRFARDDEGKLLIYGFETVEVIAATNHADILDPALLCSGRLDQKIEFPHPKEEARTKILQIHSRKMNVNPDVNFEELARSTDDFDGAQLKAVSIEAGMLALQLDATEMKLCE